MGEDKLRWYPDPIASSWDPDWSTTKLCWFNCWMNLCLTTLHDEPVQCTANDVGNGANAAVYRVEEVLRWYPNPPIASSWDPGSTTFNRIVTGLTAWC